MSTLEQLYKLRDDIRQFRELMSANVLQMSKQTPTRPKLRRSQIMKTTFSSDDEIISPVVTPLKNYTINQTIKVEDLETEIVGSPKSDIFTKTIEALSSSDSDENFTFIPPVPEVIEKPLEFSKIHISSSDDEPTETIIFDVSKKIIIDSNSSDETDNFGLSDDDDDKLEESRLLEKYL